MLGTLRVTRFHRPLGVALLGELFRVVLGIIFGALHLRRITRLRLPAIAGCLAVGAVIRQRAGGGESQRESARKRRTGDAQ